MTDSGRMTITFITGANKGLGYETARRLIEAGQTVLVGARDAERGQAAADRLGARFVPIDVADDESVAQAAQDIKAHEGRIDILINNAGILGSHAPAEQLSGPDALEIFNTNVAGIVRVTHAFVPLLRLSEHPAVVNVSSGMGSIALTHDPDRVESKPIAPLYTATKPRSTVQRRRVVRGCDLNDPLMQVRRAVPAAAGPAPGGHLHGERSAGRNEGRVR